MALHKGFSLLEIIVSLLLTAIVLTAVMQITFRVTKQDAFAKKHVSKDVKLMVMHMQLLKDISCLCALVYEEAEKSDEKSAEKTSPSTEKTSAEKTAKKDDKQPDDIKKYFYSINKDNHLDFFTFVTTNSLTFYGQPAAPLVRVTYRLIPGKEEHSGFSLTRKETTTLKFEESEKSGKSAVLLDGIKKFETTYFYVKPKKEEKGSSAKGEKTAEKAEKKSEKEEQPDLGSEKEWGIKKDDDKELQEQKIPRFIFLQCECENGLKQDFWYEIPFVFEGIPQLPQLTPSKKAPEKESEIPEGQGAADA